MLLSSHFFAGCEAESVPRAWALCAAEGFLARRDCAELPVLREVTLESPLALSCPDRTQEGSYVHALVSSLVDRQNEFLKQAGLSRTPSERSGRIFKALGGGQIGGASLRFSLTWRATR